MDAKYTDKRRTDSRLAKPRYDVGDPYLWLFERVSDGLMLFGPRGNLLKVNSHICKMLGYTRDELVGLDTSDVVLPNSAPSGLPGKSVFLPKIRLRSKNGTRINARARWLMLASGNVLALVRPLVTEDVIVANRLAAIVESADDTIIGKDLDGIVTSWNGGATRALGYTAAEMIGSSIMRLVPRERWDEERQILEKIKRGERVDHFETVRLTRAGHPLDVLVTISPVRDAAGRVIGASTIARDISERKARENEMARLSQLYAALAQINQEIVRAKTRDALFDCVCRMLVQYGGLKMAWVGHYDEEAGLIRPTAQYGDSAGFLGKIKVYGDESPEGRSPAGVAFRTGRAYIGDDRLDDPAVLPWREEMRRCGWRSVASFPVREHHDVCGVLTVYSGQGGYFHREEVLLLEEVAGDLSFALDGLALEEARWHLEAAAQSERSFSDTMIESMPGIVYVFNRAGQFVRWNSNFRSVTGYSDAEIARLRPEDFVSSNERELVKRRIDEAFDSGEASVEATLETRDGMLRPHFLTARRVTLGGEHCLLGIGLDLSLVRQYEHRLQEQEAVLLEMSAMAHIGGWSFDPVSGNGVWTDEVARIHDVDPEAATSVSFGLGFYRGEHLEKIRTAVQEAIDFGKEYDLELELVSAKGARKWVRTMCHPVKENGRVVQIRGIIQDITERKLAEDRIRRLNRVRAVLSQINSLIVRARARAELFAEVCKIATADGGFRVALLCTVGGGHTIPAAWEGLDEALLTDMMQSLASGTLEENAMIRRAIREKRALVSNNVQHDPAVPLQERYAAAGINSVGVFPLVVAGRVDGILVLLAAEGDFFHEGEMELLLELTHDVAFAIDHLNKQEQLDYLAYYDALTGLANRRLFLERVGQFARTRPEGGRLALFLLDLDRFKNVNDSLGLAAGDELLVQVAGWLRRYAKDSALIGRIERDLFGAVMPHVREDGDIARFVERSLAALTGHTFVVNGSELRMSAKIGVALFPDDGMEAETLFRNAEAALKLAKKGGDRYLFHARKMTESVAARLSLENALRRAVENEEFVLHYQPKLDLASGTVSAAEALIRWNDPKTGLVPPGKFIPLLEETGMIYEVGRWALRQAVADSLSWSGQGLPLVRIAVNVSAVQLRSADFVAEVRRQVAGDGTGAKALQLEITESMLMESMGRATAVLQAMREIGVTIAIDDFGTGFSSLSHLVHLPLDTLKIDRMFVSRMTEGPKELALVSTIINLAHSLKLNVVAEGVETDEQWRLLQLLGCDEIQGYFYSRPVPADEFAARFLVNQG